MRLRLAVLGAMALMLVPAASARAQADFNGTLNAGSPKFTWESTGSGAPDVTGIFVDPVLRCAGAAFHCEYVLLKVEAAGELALTIDNPEGVPIEEQNLCGGPCASYQDLDAYLYPSNEAGEPQGETMTNGDAEAGEPDCATSFPSESCKVRVDPGFYVLEVEYYSALETTYTGTAELLGAAAPPAPADDAPADPPASDPQPQQQPAQPQQQPAQPQESKKKKKSSAKKRRAACTKKAKKIKNKRKRSKALKRCKKIR